MYCIYTFVILCVCARALAQETRPAETPGVRTGDERNSRESEKQTSSTRTSNTGAPSIHLSLCDSDNDDYDNICVCVSAIQMNAKKATEKRYTEALSTFGLSKAFVNSKAPAGELDYVLSGRSMIHTPLTHRSAITQGVNYSAPITHTHTLSLQLLLPCFYTVPKKRVTSTLEMRYIKP